MLNETKKLIERGKINHEDAPGALARPDDAGRASSILQIARNYFGG